MTSIVPNSIEFAMLDYGEKRRILESRASKIDLLFFEDEDEPEFEMKHWHYDTEALAKWNDNVHLARCTSDSTGMRWRWD